MEEGLISTMAGCATPAATTELVPTRLHFGRASRHQAPELTREIGRRVMVVTTPTAMEKAGFLGELLAGLRAIGCEVACTPVPATGPTTAEIDGLAALARRHRAEVMVALGGGTVIDATKAAAAVVGSSASCADLLRGKAELVAALPIIAIPSTAGTGSEMNRSAILTDPNGQFRDGLRSDQLFPRHALVDPDISATQPWALAACLAFDALSHAIESYVSPRAQPETDALAEKAIERIAAAARALADGRITPSQQEDLALHSALMGVNLSRVGTCLPHRLDKAVCAIFPHIPHAQSVAFFFPHWIQSSWPGAVVRFARIARWLDPATLALGDKEAATACADLAAALLHRLGLGRKPATFGITAADLPRILTRVAGDLSANPVPVTPVSLQRILDQSLQPPGPVLPQPKSTAKAGPTSTGTGATLRERLASRSGLLRLIGVHDVKGAWLAERAGFDGLWASSLEITTAAGRLDDGWEAARMVQDRAGEIARASTLPVVSDFQLDCRDLTDAEQRIASLTAAGSAGLCMQDSLFPCPNSLLPGEHPLAAMEDFAAALRMARQTAPAEVAIIARVQSLVAGRGQADAMARAHLYVEAGADALVIHSRRRDPSEVMEFAAAWDGGAPLVLIPSTFPQLTLKQATLTGKIGMIIYANHGLRASIAAMEQVFREILRDGGSGRSEEWITPLDDVFKLQNDPRTQRQ